MGQHPSKWARQPLFRSFVGPLPVADPLLWDRLLDADLSIPASRQQLRELLDTVAPELEGFDAHDLKSGNLSSLTTLCVSLLERLESFPDLRNSSVAKVVLQRARNALFVIRLCVLWFFARHGEASLGLIVDHCDPTDQAWANLLGEQQPAMAVNTKLADLAFGMPQGDDSMLHLSVNQSFRTDSDITDALASLPASPEPRKSASASKPMVVCQLAVQVAHSMSLPMSAATLPVVLESVNLLLTLMAPQMLDASGQLQNPVIDQIITDDNASYHVVHSCLLHFIEASNMATHKDEVDGIVHDLLSIISLPLQAYSYVFEEEVAKTTVPPGVVSLPRQSTLLLIALFFQQPTSGQNLCRSHLQKIEDAADVGSHHHPDSIKLSFAALFSALADRMAEEETQLLLYVLLQHCPGFSTYLLSRVGDFEPLIVPFLEVLYTCEPNDAAKMYLLLVIVLRLSQDGDFTQCMQTAVVAEVPWFQERVLKQVTVSDLLVLVLVRIAHRNLKSQRDEFLHRTCLASLANMAPLWSNLHPFACQRLVSLYKMLARQFLKACQDDPAGREVVGSAVHELGGVLGLVLAVINSCLANRLRHNPNLVYTLMVEKAEFAPFRDHPRFAYEIENIDILLKHFENRINWRQTESLSVDDVLAVIREGARQLPDDRLKVGHQTTVGT